MTSKFVIKPYQSHATMTKEGAHETWQQLDSAITQIHDQNASSLSFEELYRQRATLLDLFLLTSPSNARKAYNMVLYKHGKILYDRLDDKV